MEWFLEQGMKESQFDYMHTQCCDWLYSPYLGIEWLPLTFFHSQVHRDTFLYLPSIYRDRIDVPINIYTGITYLSLLQIAYTLALSFPLVLPRLLLPSLP